MKKKGIDLRQSSVKKIVCIGEPIRRPNFDLNTLGTRIKGQWDVDLYSTYASTEMGTAFTECEAGRGGHQHPELIVTEILDPDGQPVKPGEAGELVVTPLGLEAMPLLRFKTGDVCRQHINQCSCGRITSRLGPIEGRRQQMIKLKGTSLYPPALFDVLNGIEAITQYVVTVDHDEWQLDQVHVEFSTKHEEEEVYRLLKEKFRSYIRVVPSMRCIGHEEITKKTIDPMSRKPIRLIDLRKQTQV